MATGDFIFYLDSAAFRGREGRVLEEISVRIPNNEIVFKEHKGAYRSRVKIYVKIEDTQGKTVIEEAWKMDFTEPSEDKLNTAIYFQTVIKRFHIPPGVYNLSYAIEDLESSKRTMIGMIKGKHNLASTRGLRLELPDYRDDIASFSQPKFLWSVDTIDGEVVYHPNPPRLYGLYKDTLEVYVELYLPDEVARATTFEFRTEITSDDGEVLQATSVDLPNPDPGRTGVLRGYPMVIRQDLNQIKAGSYALYLYFGLDGTTMRRVRSGRFSIAWDIRTWELSRRQYLAEARFLLDDDSFTEFKTLAFGDQEIMMDQLWKSVDPTPETSINESYERFLARLAYVGEHFGGADEAIFTPRGTIYMKYGPPDEFVEDVVPLNRDTLAEAMQVVEDRFHTVNFTNYGAKPYNNTVQYNNLIDPRGLSQQREGDHSAYPFQLWSYTANGDPILDRDRSQEIDMGMRYLFIDREGYGRYRLESSSSISNK